MKEELMLFTGWGATCDVWKLIIPALSERYQINCHTPSWLPDNTMSVSLEQFDQYIDQLAASMIAPSKVVAWSMGGLLATALAKRHAGLVDKICFIASVPNFVNEHNEHAGIDFHWFETFVQQYQQQPLATLKRFLTLQSKGDEYAKTTLKELKACCPFETYNIDECGKALQLMSQLDLTTALRQLECESLFIQGQQDAVINAQAVQQVATMANSSVHWLAQAGHAPHLSHSAEVIDVIDSFFNSSQH